MTKRHLLIDGDIIAYKVAASCEEPVHWGEDQWTLHADAKEGKIQVDNFIEMLQDELTASKVSVYLSSPKNFRKELYPEYKANRKSVRKPMILPALKDHMKKEWNNKQSCEYKVCWTTCKGSKWKQHNAVSVRDEKYA